MKLFLSYASAIKLGLKKGLLNYPLKTIYIMFGSNCINVCKFCTQASFSRSKDCANLSRIYWYEYNEDKIVEAINKTEVIKRVCFQVVSEKNFEYYFLEVLKKFNNNQNIKISVSINSTSEIFLNNILSYNIENLTIPLDCATNRVYSLMKGNDFYDKINTLIKLSIKNRFRINTHIIYGLGDTQKEIYDLFLLLKRFDINVGLFSFFPIIGTQIENIPQPSISDYRKIQILRYLIFDDICFNAIFNANENLSKLYIFDVDKYSDSIKIGKPFQTSGCNDCTRPYYNEKPGKQIYNYHQNLNKLEIENCYKELMKDLEVTYLR